MTTRKKKQRTSRLALRLMMPITAPKLPPAEMCAVVIRLQRELEGKEDDLEDCCRCTCSRRWRACWPAAAWT